MSNRDKVRHLFTINSYYPQVKVDTKFSMTPELTIVIDKKEDEVAAALADNIDRNGKDITSLLMIGKLDEGNGETK